jgi:hypothetical protein
MSRSAEFGWLFSCRWAHAELVVVSNLDPYRPPAASIAPVSSAAVANCPKCGHNVATKVGYNWWGGALGPKLFHVVKCSQCRAQYNGRTGAKLTGVIIGYQAVVLVVLAVAWLALRP